MRMQGAADRPAGPSTFQHSGLNIAAARQAARLLLLGPLLTGCVGVPMQLGADPADPHVPVAQVGYRPTVAPYVSLRPTLPKAPTSWGDLNRRVAPAPGSER